jgi:hypothetical protein
MTRRLTWIPVAAAALALTSPALPAEDSEPVTLAFKFVQGAARKYRMDTKADLTLMQGGGGLGALPITFKSALVFTEKITGVQDGVGALAVTPLVMTIDTAALGMNTSMRMEGGKMTINGQPAPPSANAGGIAGMTGRVINLRRTATGETSGAEGGATRGVISSTHLMQLPDKPVKVGDSWETVLVMQPNLPLAGPQELPEVEIKLTHTLKALQPKGGKLHALIESAGGGATPEGGSVVVQQKYAGTSRFDVSTGSVASGDYSMDLHMESPLPSGLAPGGDQAMPKRLQIDGTMKFVLSEQPLTAPAKKPVPAKKPAPRTAPAKKPVKK